MKSAVIGYSGFVGSNLCKQTLFDDFYNSQNIAELVGKDYDLIVCAGIPSAMWLANNKPEQDLEQILQLVDIIKSCRAKRIVLISSIAIYDSSKKGVIESDDDKYEQTLAYGRNRRIAEVALQEHFEHCHILRLPALFGSHIKKNFLYDLCNLEPAFLNAQAWNNLINRIDGNELKLIISYYKLNEANGMYAFQKEAATTDGMRQCILSIMQLAQSTSLNFTHPESKFQFYDLGKLWADIQLSIKHDIPVLNICSEPIVAKDIAKQFFGIDMQLRGTPVRFDYDMRSEYASLWGGLHYQYSRENLMQQLAQFFNQMKP